MSDAPPTPLESCSRLLGSHVTYLLTLVLAATPDGQRAREFYAKVVPSSVLASGEIALSFGTAAAARAIWVGLPGIPGVAAAYVEAPMATAFRDRYLCEWSIAGVFCDRTDEHDTLLHELCVTLTAGATDGSRARLERHDGIIRFDGPGGTCVLDAQYTSESRLRQQWASYTGAPAAAPSRILAPITITVTKGDDGLKRAEVRLAGNATGEVIARGASADGDRAIVEAKAETFAYLAKAARRLPGLDALFTVELVDGAS